MSTSDAGITAGIDASAPRRVETGGEAKEDARNVLLYVSTSDAGITAGIDASAPRRRGIDASAPRRQE